MRVGGTGAGVVTIAALAEAAATVGVRIEALPSLGSTGGVRALGDGRIDLAIIGRAMTPEEMKPGLQVVFELRTPFVFVTSLPAAPSMTPAELVAAYGDPRARWPSGGPVAVVLRQRSDGDAIMLNGLIPGMDAAVELARKRPGVPVSAVDDDNAEYAERTKGSLATMSYSQVMIEARRVRTIAINGVAPSLQALADGSYPYSRPFYLVVPAKPGAAAQRFVAFLQSDAGRDALRGVHSVVGAAP
jgi:phosphate transport system substrate-binding protein